MNDITIIIGESEHEDTFYIVAKKDGKQIKSVTQHYHNHSAFINGKGRDYKISVINNELNNMLPSILINLGLVEKEEI